MPPTFRSPERISPLGLVALGGGDCGLERSSGWRRSGERLPDVPFEADLSERNLAKRDDRCLVALRIDVGSCAGRELPGPASRQDAKGKAIVDVLDAILDGDAGHADLGADGWGETVLRIRRVLEGLRCRRRRAAQR